MVLVAVEEHHVRGRAERERPAVDRARVAQAVVRPGRSTVECVVDHLLLRGRVGVGEAVVPAAHHQIRVHQIRPGLVPGPAAEKHAALVAVPLRAVVARAPHGGDAGHGGHVVVAIVGEDFADAEVVDAEEVVDGVDEAAPRAVEERERRGDVDLRDGQVLEARLDVLVEVVERGVRELVRGHVGAALDQVLPGELGDAEGLLHQRRGRRVGGDRRLERVEEDGRAERPQRRDDPIADGVDVRIDGALRERERVAADGMRRHLATEGGGVGAERAARDEIADEEELARALHRPDVARAVRVGDQGDGLVEVGPEVSALGVGEARGQDDDLLVVGVRELGRAAGGAVGLDALPGRIEPPPAGDVGDGGRVEGGRLRGGGAGEECEQSERRKQALQGDPPDQCES